jgi:hypothetical protein
MSWFGSGGSAAGAAGGAARGLRREDTSGDAAYALMLQRELDVQVSLKKSEQFSRDHEMAVTIARADEERPAGDGHHAHKRRRMISIDDPANGRTVHVLLTNAETGHVLLLRKTVKRPGDEDTWDFAGGNSNPRESIRQAGLRETGEELCGSGIQPTTDEGRAAMKAKSTHLQNMLQFLVEQGTVKAVVVHSDKHSVNIALIFPCKNIEDFMGLLGLPNQQESTRVKTSETFMSKEHRGWLLIHYLELKKTDSNKKTVVKVHGKEVHVTLTNKNMCCSDLCKALQYAMEDAVNPDL